jgi:heme-degrading monooxygenase HmoA
MFTRVVEITTRSEKMHELGNSIRNKVLPILREQPGFLEEIVLISAVEPNRVLAISFWSTKADAERYEREQYGAISEVVAGFVEHPPVIRTFYVHTSTAHHFASENGT